MSTGIISSVASAPNEGVAVKICVLTGGKVGLAVTVGVSDVIEVTVGATEIPNSVRFVFVIVSTGVYVLVKKVVEVEG